MNTRRFTPVIAVLLLVTSALTHAPGVMLPLAAMKTSCRPVFGIFLLSMASAGFAGHQAKSSAPVQGHTVVRPDTSHGSHSGLAPSAPSSRATLTSRARHS